VHCVGEFGEFVHHKWFDEGRVSVQSRLDVRANIRRNIVRPACMGEAQMCPLQLAWTYKRELVESSPELSVSGRELNLSPHNSCEEECCKCPPQIAYIGES
jgi:hypothetical protein